MVAASALRFSIGKLNAWTQDLGIQHFSSHFDVAAPIEIIRDFHGSTEALPLLTPPPLSVRTIQGGIVEEGMVAKFRLSFARFGIEWHARHKDVTLNSFVDVQDHGPLRSWCHTHRFESLGANRTRVHDDIEYEFHPGEGPFVRLFFSKPALKVLFAFRGHQTRKHCGLRLRAARHTSVSANTGG